MAINPSSFVTSTALEDFSVRYANEQADFIASEVFPPIMVSKSDFKIYQYNTSNFKEVDTQKGSKSEADLVDYGVFTTSVTAALHKLAGESDPADEKDFDRPVANVKQDISATIMDKLLIRYERLAASLATTSSNYPAALTSTLGGGATWDSTGGNPEADANTARLAVKGVCGKMPNAVAMSYQGWSKLLASPAIIDRIKYVNGTKPTEEVIKNLLGVDFLHVGKAQYISAVEGNATQTLNDVWDDSAIFYVKDPSPRLKSVRYGATYMRNKLYTFEYDVNERGSGDGRIHRIEMGWWYKVAPGAVVSSADSDFTAGYLLKNIF